MTRNVKKGLDFVTLYLTFFLTLYLNEVHEVHILRVRYMNQVSKMCGRGRVPGPGVQVLGFQRSGWRVLELWVREMNQ